MRRYARPPTSAATRVAACVAPQPHAAAGNPAVLLLARGASGHVTVRKAEHAHAVFVVGQSRHAGGFAIEPPEFRGPVPRCKQGRSTEFGQTRMAN